MVISARNRLRLWLGRMKDESAGDIACAYGGYADWHAESSAPMDAYGDDIQNRLRLRARMVTGTRNRLRLWAPMSGRDEGWGDENWWGNPAAPMARMIAYTRNRVRRW
jgi:hypothetical protein